MTVLVDENLSPEICEVFRSCGHRVKYISESMPGALDPEVLRTAELLRAVIVTQNAKDFRRDISRAAAPTSPRIRFAGRLFIEQHVPSPASVAGTLPLIEAEFIRRLGMKDSRLIAEISTAWVRFEL